jgi:acyl dehydratase
VTDPRLPFDLPVGTYEEARAWIGRSSGFRLCEDEVNHASIKYFCSLVEDANPAYWDETWAREHWGGILSPPGMLFVWSMPLPWRPGGARGPATLATQVPLPGDTVINVSTDSEFLHPVRVGDRLGFEERVVEVSPEKRTSLGPGHFVTTEFEYRNQAGRVVALHRNVLFRFRADPSPRPKGVSPAAREEAPAASEPPPEGGSGAGDRRWEDVREGEELPRLRMTVTLARCVLDAAATRDYFPGHHDRDYARSQNVRDAYLNTMFFQGWVDRVGGEWAGPLAWLRRRRLEMMAPVCVGDTIRTEGSVLRRYEQGREARVDVEIRVSTDGGLAARAASTYVLPRRGEGAVGFENAREERR